MSYQTNIYNPLTNDTVSIIRNKCIQVMHGFKIGTIHLEFQLLKFFNKLNDNLELYQVDFLSSSLTYVSKT